MSESPRPQQGASDAGRGRVAWRLWAPYAENVSLVVFDGPRPIETPMDNRGRGHFTCRRPGREGLRYLYRLPDGHEYPDPASRWQPDGVHAPSAVFFPDNFAWTDRAWRGVPRDDLVIYELHVGTFTPEGTLAAIVPRLGQLASLGITAIELMPLAQFPGARNWGYDGAYPCAVQASYGGPRALQRLIDAAHAAGLAVLIDVVYNHLGPEGNYLPKFGPYFTEQYRTPWGTAVNYDGPQCDPVRRFVVDNARMWVRDFHADGLRLDAVHAIYDLSARHILTDVARAVRREAARQGRPVHVIAETSSNDVRLVSPTRRGGIGLDALWSDDFHHSVHTLLTGQRDGYYVDYGRPEDLAKTLTDVFAYDGRYSEFRKRRHGTRVGRRRRDRFVFCIQNHDQVGNRAGGERLSALVPPAAHRMAVALLLLAPCAPLIFMGDEYGETQPFPFFCSFGDPGLIEAVRRGRRAEFAELAFRWSTEVPDPQSPETFESAKLSWAWPDGSPQARMRQLYADLLAARRNWPAFRDRQHAFAWIERPRGETAGNGGSAVLMMRRGIDHGLLVAANLTGHSQPILAVDRRASAPVLSTEDPRYGGRRRPEQPWSPLHPYELICVARGAEGP